MVNQEGILTKLTEGIYTQEDLELLLGDVEEANRWVYKGGSVPLSKKISGSVSEGFRKKIESLESEENLPGNRKELAALFRNLLENLEKMVKAKLTLAFAPSDEFLTKLAGWFEAQTGKKIVLDIQIDESIIAGCRLEYSGEYRDYSLGEKLEAVLDQEIKGLV
ncbi:MAG: F0F1 ATP synthase subunit delta [Candidatus Woykebacteria bacterium]